MQCGWALEIQQYRIHSLPPISLPLPRVPRTPILNHSFHLKQHMLSIYLVKIILCQDSTQTVELGLCTLTAAWLIRSTVVPLQEWPAKERLAFPKKDLLM